VYSNADIRNHKNFAWSRDQLPKLIRHGKFEISDFKAILGVGHVTMISHFGVGHVTMISRDQLPILHGHVTNSQKLIRHGKFEISEM
jgi:hypothetical protein